MQDKSALDDLAVFGGTPASEEVLHVGRPNIGDRERLLERINDILERKWLTNDGPYVQEFERRVAAFVGVKHCIAMCNATVALEIAIRALEMKGEVIIPSFTFIATAHALQWQEITPVFCDIDPHIHNLDPIKVEEMITPRTTGIIGVHLWGRACDVDSLSDIAARRGLKLLLDSAHAFGCSHKGRMIGGFGHAEVFSFHATKFLNSLEGGAVVTNDDQVARKMRLMKNFGFTYYDRSDYIGTNGKMNEISAAMGVTNLEAMDEFIAVNYRNYQKYGQELAGLEGIDLIAYDEKEKCNYQYVVIEIDESKIGITRDQLMEVLQAENVLVRRYFYPGCHRMEPYRSSFPHAGLMLPETEKLTTRVLCLPTGTSVSEDQISDICQIIRFAVEHEVEITRRLNEGRVPTNPPTSISARQRD
ncbi:MAG: aminotransferase class I/II-fold pyridoxal phosphate-dependent enzyme [Pyrinomonadaceae bacterium]|nr:aminotransferase class I/II-fold pyridoxal phosphate-dependent enzyme [Pyrinomonadaceae bacterium]